MNLVEHPTVKKIQEAGPGPGIPRECQRLDAGWLRTLALESGADDAGVVSVERPELDPDRSDIVSHFPWAKSLLSFVCRTNREPIRNPARSISNLEFHTTGHHVNEVARKIVNALQERGVRAVNPAMGFPMEMHRFPEKIWAISHKNVAVAAGLGQMGIHRNVIHPKFGNFILLGTVVIDAAIDTESRPIDYNPCLECKLCVAVCPVGAIGADGHFNFSACYTHNYREFMGGFTDWVEQIADSKNARDYRKRVSDPESASMWQSLSFEANYKSAYCMAVCPAGEDVIRPFLEDRKSFLDGQVRPLQQKPETVYVTAGSDAERHVERRFPNKRTKRVGSGLRPGSIRGFLNGLPLTFQRGASEGIDAAYHFTFTGEEPAEATVVIRDRTVRVEDGRHGKADLHITADSRAWLDFVAKNRSLAGALLARKIRLRGSPKHLLNFAKCFPS